MDISTIARKLFLAAVAVGASGCASETSRPEYVTEQNTVQHVPSFPKELDERIALLAREHRFDDAEKVLNDARATYDPREVDAKLGGLYALQERFPEAESMLERALKPDPEFKTGLRALAMLRFMQERWRDAAAVFDRLEPRLSDEEKYFQAPFATQTRMRIIEQMGSGTMQQRPGETVAAFLNEMIHHYDKVLAIEQYANNAGLHSSRGALLVGRNRFDEALKDYVVAMHLEPTLSEAYSGYAFAFLRQNKPELILPSFYRVAVDSFLDVKLLYGDGPAMLKKWKEDLQQQHILTELLITPDKNTEKFFGGCSAYQLEAWKLATENKKKEDRFEDNRWPKALELNSLAGAAAYGAALKNGKTAEDAFAAFDAATKDRYQQVTDWLGITLAARNDLAQRHLALFTFDQKIALYSQLKEKRK
jgi:tetratricopeptide (TPR) repeat protein